MGKTKYFRTLPENQRYLYKSFAAVGKAEGTLCDECGAYIQNIVQVVGSVDHITYNLGLTCCEKQAKMDKGLDLDDKVAVQVKFWKSRLQKLSKFRKSFDKAHTEDTIAIQGHFMYDPRKQIALLDFGFLYNYGEWYWMHEDFPLTKIYDKVKDTFKDVWDQVDWMGADECAKMSTSAEVYQALKSDTVKVYDWNKWCEKTYPVWYKQDDIRRAVNQSVKDAGWAYGKDTPVRLPEWFNPYDYPEGMFDEVVANLKDDWWCRPEDLAVTEFIVTNKEALKRQKAEAAGEVYEAPKTKAERIGDLAKAYQEGKITMDDFVAQVTKINAEPGN